MMETIFSEITRLTPLFPSVIICEVLKRERHFYSNAVALVMHPALSHFRSPCRGHLRGAVQRSERFLLAHESPAGARGPAGR